MTTPEQTSDNAYAMLRGSEQVIRVNLIQFVWAETLGYLLHPIIPQNMTKVADLATATGLWLCELNAERTRLQRSTSMTVNNYEVLDGFDISAESFLPDNQKPSKVKLRVQDATSEVPSELRGKYDVVHVRLITPGVFDGDPTPIIKHCHDLLRPGGYLQWEEFDILDYKIVMKDDDMDPTESHLQQVFDVFKKGSSKEWIAQLPTTLENHGFSVKVADKMREPEWHRTIMTHLGCAVIGEISRGRLDKFGPPGAGEKLRATIKAALEENLGGSYVSSLFQVVVAQKAE